MHRKYIHVHNLTLAKISAALGAKINLNIPLLRYAIFVFIYTHTLEIT